FPGLLRTRHIRVQAPSFRAIHPLEKRLDTRVRWACILDIRWFDPVFGDKIVTARDKCRGLTGTRTRKEKLVLRRGGGYRELLMGLAAIGLADLFFCDAIGWARETLLF